MYYNEITVTEQMFGGGKFMSFSDILKTVFEVVLVLVTLWALFHEDRFIAVERKIAAAFRRRRIKAVKGRNNSGYGIRVR